MSPIHTALTFELNIFSLVLILMCFALQIVLNMMNATLAFCILALTSSSVPPFLLICICICYWQNVLGTHHASAHGGSFGLVVKMLDYIFWK